jgi:hypothetical protein
MATVTAYNLGNADTTRIDLNNGKKLLVDYANMRCKTNPDDKRVDLPAQLLKDLTDNKRDYYDIVAFTHLDNDHICGSTKFFYLLHNAQYQGAGRIHIKEMWVPAAAILEKADECNEEAKILRAEAQYRLKKGEGIRVFSNPGKLDDWLKRRQIDPASRKHLITDAGNLIPGFSLTDDGVEFFVHSPFASRSNEGALIERNSDALTFQATFEECGRKTRMHFFSDIDWEVVKYIVRVTRNRAKKDASRLDRLKWDVFHLPHHSSAYSLSADKGQDITVPDPDIKELFEIYGEYNGIMISPSDEILTVDTIQPPHRQAANYYRSVAKLKSGSYLVTMEQPTTASPKPLVIQIDRFGATVKKDTGGSSAAVIGSQITPRAGSRF